MKNYKVESIMRFTDKVEFVRRNAGEIFYCTEERYNFLKNKNAIKLIEIVEEKEEISEKEVQAVANAIVEEAIEQDKTIEEVVNEIVDEAVEEGFEKPKKKKTSKK
jgi:hypothetical protein